MSDQDETTEARLEALESLVRRALSGGGADAPLAGDVQGPESATVLMKIAALAGGGVRDVAVDNLGAVIAGPAIRSGTSALTAAPPGQVTILVPGFNPATSRVVVTMIDPLVAGGAQPITGMAAFEVPSSARFAGQFSVAIVDDTGTVIPTARCSFDWIVVL